MDQFRNGNLGAFGSSEQPDRHNTTQQYSNPYNQGDTSGFGGYGGNEHDYT